MSQEDKIKKEIRMILRIQNEVHQERMKEYGEKYKDDERIMKLAVELGHYKGLYRTLIRELEGLIK